MSIYEAFRGLNTIEIVLGHSHHVKLCLVWVSLVIAQTGPCYVGGGLQGAWGSPCSLSWSKCTVLQASSPNHIPDPWGSKGNLMAVSRVVRVRDEDRQP